MAQNRVTNCHFMLLLVGRVPRSIASLPENQCHLLCRFKTVSPLGPQSWAFLSTQAFCPFVSVSRRSACVQAIHPSTFLVTYLFG